jgi:hypothetical protein
MAARLLIANLQVEVTPDATSVGANAVAIDGSAMRQLLTYLAKTPIGS